MTPKKVASLHAFSIAHGKDFIGKSCGKLSGVATKLLDTLQQTNMATGELAQADGIIRSLEKRAGLTSTSSIAGAALALPDLQRRAIAAQEMLALKGVAELVERTELSLANTRLHQLYSIEDVRENCELEDSKAVCQQLKTLLESGDSNTIRAGFVALCKERAGLQDTLLGFTHQQGAMNTACSLLYDAAMLLFRPSSQRQLLSALLPHVTHVYELTSRGFTSIPLEQALNTSLDSPVPNHRSLFKQVVLHKNTLVLVDDFTQLDFGHYQKLHHTLQEAHPELERQLFSHNADFVLLRSMLEEEPTLGDAVAQLADVFSKNGEKYSGNAFSTDKAKDDFDAFVVYWKKFPDEVRQTSFGQHLQGLLDRVDRDSCIELAAGELKKLLTQHAKIPELQKKPSFNLEEAKKSADYKKALRRRDRDPLDSRRSGITITALPLELVEKILPSDIDDLELLDDLLRAVPTELYPHLLRISGSLVNSLKLPHPGLSAEQNAALSQAIAAKLPATMEELGQAIGRLDNPEFVDLLTRVNQKLAIEWITSRMSLKTYAKFQNRLLPILVGTHDADVLAASTIEGDPSNPPTMLKLITACHPTLLAYLANFAPIQEIVEKAAPKERSLALARLLPVWGASKAVLTLPTYVQTYTDREKIELYLLLKNDLPTRESRTQIADILISDINWTQDNADLFPSLVDKALKENAAGKLFIPLRQGADATLFLALLSHLPDNMKGLPDNMKGRLEDRARAALTDTAHIFEQGYGFKVNEKIVANLLLAYQIVFRIEEWEISSINTLLTTTVWPSTKLLQDTKAGALIVAVLAKENPKTATALQQHLISNCPVPSLLRVVTPFTKTIPDLNKSTTQAILDLYSYGYKGTDILNKFLVRREGHQISPFHEVLLNTVELLPAVFDALSSVDRTVLQKAIDQPIEKGTGLFQKDKRIRDLMTPVQREKFNALLKQYGLK